MWLFVLRKGIQTSWQFSWSQPGRVDARGMENAAFSPRVGLPVFEAGTVVGLHSGCPDLGLPVVPVMEHFAASFTETWLLRQHNVRISGWTSEVCVCVKWS